MHVIILILLVVAAIAFGLATFGVPSRISWIGLGLLAWVLAVLVPALSAN